MYDIAFTLRYVTMYTETNHMASRLILRYGHARKANNANFVKIQVFSLNCEEASFSVGDLIETPENFRSS